MPFGLLARSVSALALIGYGDSGAQLSDWQRKYVDGMSALKQGRLADARAALPAMYEAARKLPDGDIWKTQGAFGLASLRLAEGDLSAAETLFKEARAAAEREGNAGSLLGAIWNGLGEVYVSQLRFDAAEEAMRTAFSKYGSDLLGAQGRLLCRRHIGEIRMLRGDLAGAEEMLRPLIAAEKERPSAAPALLASALTALGRTYMLEARWAESESCLKQAAALERAYADEAALADTLLATATLYRAEGRLERAEPLLRKVLKTYAALGDPRIAFAYSQMSLCAAAERKYATAGALLNRAVEAARIGHMPERVIAGMKDDLASAETEFATAKRPAH